MLAGGIEPDRGKRPRLTHCVLLLMTLCSREGHQSYMLAHFRCSCSSGCFVGVAKALGKACYPYWHLELPGATSNAARNQQYLGVVISHLRDLWRTY